MDTAWQLLTNGNATAAIAELRRDYRQDQSIVTLRNLGIAYLCDSQYHGAANVFSRLIEENPHEAASDYIQAGVANWLLHNREDAVRVWRGALDCSHGDAAGNMSTPLLLYYVAVTMPELFSLKEAISLLERHLTLSVSYHWPGGIARMLLGRIDRLEAEEHKSCQKWTYAYETAELEFYDGIGHRLCGDERGCRKHLQLCVDCGNVGMYAPVWFLAKNELGLIAIREQTTRGE